MPRPLRPQFRNAIYHVNTVGVRRSIIFPDDRAHEMFLILVSIAVSRYDWICGSYCLLGNHYHLLVQTPDANIGRGMQFLNGVYAQWFNQTYGTRGHAFESRYYSVLAESSDHLVRAARYIALNPVEAGICRRAEDWRWSSYRALAGIERAPRFLTDDLVLSELADSPNAARQAFRRIVEEGEPPEWPPT